MCSVSQALDTDRRPALTNMAATGPVGLFQFKLIKVIEDEQFNSSVSLAMLEALTSHMGPVGIILDSTDRGHVHLCPKFYWAAPL